MRVAGKVWGRTAAIEVNSSLELHVITATAGHKCSKHRHQIKFNGFYVIDGSLKIRVWKDDSGTIDETILTDGEWMVVPPGEYHQFEALQNTEALELYWVELPSEDIDRETFGE